MIAILFVAAALAAAAPQQASHDHPPGTSERPVTLLTGMGNVRHPIQTRNADAQRFFDQGLTFVYAFNHEEAIRSFRKAAELDPRSPMPLWGVALALGPNINLDVDPAREKEAYDTVQQALKLLGNAPANERAYVNALAKRYSDDPKADLKALAVQYKDAMKALAQAFPNDLDAATLYAESLMDLRPWQLYANDGTPNEGTAEIVDVLETVLRKNPNHVGANHYYVHATEASLAPERALASARRLETLVPAAGHLVHMPAHTYMRTGDYAGAVKANARAAEVDRRYIAETGADGVYPAMYYNHNLDFLVSAAMMTGQFAEASKTSAILVESVQKMVGDMPMIEPFGAKTIYVLLRFAKWQELLALPAPDGKSAILTTVYRFGRTFAQAMLGAAAAADAERAAYEAAKKTIAADTPWLYNSTPGMLAVFDAVLDARLAAMRNDAAGAIAAWRRAVAAEDVLNYDEPPDWFYPTRESLGAALLKAGRTDDAERVFREDLEKNPRNARSLFGLWQTLRTVDPRGAATQVAGRRFQDAWKDADVELKLTDF